MSSDEVCDSGPSWACGGAASECAIAWRNVSIYAKVRNKKFFGKNDRPYKRIVNNVSGIVKAGNLVVMMGPSGAGKSTLMGALAHRNANDVVVEGDIRVNGVPAGKNIHKFSGFMHQDDLFIGSLTVREHLEFTARLKLREKGVSQIVDRFIMEMGMVSCQHTKIGRIGEENCISGGERKRLALAAEMLTDPPLLFCDEPTTGLDSFSAQTMIKLMKLMCYRGKTILCTIHQPSSELFAMFQQLILLAEGRIAFIGEGDDAIDFFKKMGYACPENCNPSEVFMQALSVTAGSAAKVKRICDEFTVSDKGKEIDDLLTNILEEEPTASILDNVGAKSARWPRKLYWLTYRSFLQVLREPSVQIIRIFQKVGIAIMAALCFFGSANLNQAGVQSIQGAVFVLVTENTFPPMYGVLSLFPDEFPFFLREHQTDLYSVHLYYFSKMMSFLPGLIVEPILFVVAAYFIIGLKNTFYAFLMTNLIAIVTTNVAAACGFFFANAFGSVSMALAFLVPLDYTLMVTSGLFIKLSSLSYIISWFCYLSWFKYANEALTIIQWEDVKNITCEYVNPEIPCIANGEEVLEKFDFSSSHLIGNIGSMILMYFIFHILSFFFLKLRTNGNF